MMPCENSRLSPLETFRHKRRLHLSHRNSIFCPESGALIGRRSNQIVLAIVYEWQKKDKRSQKGQT